MSLELPSKAEVLEWSPHQLADFLKRMDLAGSDKIVLKNMMSGSRFLTMSDNDLQRFPRVHAPLISKLVSEINKKEERRGLFAKSRSTGPRYPDAGHQRVSADHQTGNHSFSSDSQAAGWAEDEFTDSDDCQSDDCEDYENPDADYESPTEEDGAFADDDYEPPPCEPADNLSRQPCPALPLPGGDYIDNRRFSRGGQPLVMPRPPEPAPLHSTRLDSNPKIPPFSAAPPVFREKKRLLDMPPKHHTFPLPTPGRGELPPRPLPSGPLARNADSLPPSLPAADFLPQRLMSVVGVHRSRSSVGDIRAPPAPRPPPTEEEPHMSTQDLDRRWYVGKVTRRQAESCLKQVNKDGAYVVRDSKSQADGQPFTLMVLYKDRVFNIQIRRHDRTHEYLLGTGSQTFRSVSDIISHYSQSALLLINAKIRGQQNHCVLSHPAGWG